MPETKTASNSKSKPRRTKRKVIEDRALSYFEAAAKRDAAGMAGHWAEDGVESIPGAAPLRGPKQIQAYFEEMFAGLPDARMVVKRVVANDTGAAVEWRLTGTFTGQPWQGLEPTGRHIEIAGTDLLEFKGGKIVALDAYFDTTEVARQIGMMPPADSGAERAMKSAFNTVTKVRRAVSERTGS